MIIYLPVNYLTQVTVWGKVIENAGLSAEKDIAACRSQWVERGDGAVDEVENWPGDWPFYKILFEYSANKHNFRPPYTVSRTEGVLRKKTENLAVNQTTSMYSSRDNFTPSKPVASTSTSSSTPKNLNLPSTTFAPVRIMSNRQISAAFSTSSNSNSAFPSPVPFASSSSQFPRICRSSRTTPDEDGLTPPPLVPKKKPQQITTGEVFEYIKKEDKKQNKTINDLFSIFSQMVQADNPNINTDNLINISDSDSEKIYKETYF